MQYDALALQTEIASLKRYAVGKKVAFPIVIMAKEMVI